MIIEIPDEFLDYMKNMPPLSGGRDVSKIRSMAKWAAREVPCYVYTPVFINIVRNAMRQGLIVQDIRAGKWQGVDHNGD